MLRAFEQERENLLRLAARRLGDLEEARDIVQDAFIRAAGASDQSIDDRPAYLRTIVINLVRDRMRRRNSAGVMVDLQQESDPLEWTAADTPSVEQVIYHRQRLEAFEKALRTLTPRSREVFILRKLHGKSHDEIASVTGLSQSAIEKHLYRALSACRDILEKLD
ncbi:RNA polymerase sigma factor [Thalassospira aquimaris]|uniref:RNA polymerase sigma factor n=1 Tax=Thalassospira aquimaris TaxID=3037796 RepID=UPI00241434AE|nr:RNA polymerase sigma factor [Thalassospira sp. FZY0004]